MDVFPQPLVSPVTEHELLLALGGRAVTLQVVEAPPLPAPGQARLAFDWLLGLLPLIR